VEAECAVRGALPSEVFASPEHLERVAAKVVRALQDAALLGCVHRGQ
jgi:hypothetical protein